MPAQTQPVREEGFVLIEILVSAMILVIASAGVAAVLAGAVGTSGEQRHASEAYALAQEDQSRLTNMQLARLNHYSNERSVTLNGTTFTVHSYAVWVNSNTNSQSCTEGSVSADYVQITSVVTWPGMTPGEKAKIESILSPSGAASLDPNSPSGVLAISVTNEAGEAIPHVALSGAQQGGTGSFTGESDANGCAIFPNLPTTSSTGQAAPNYTVSVNGEFAHVVNKDGSATETTTGAAKTEKPQILSLRLDHPGTIPISFKYRVGSSSEFKPASAASLVVFNTGMTTAKTFWTEGAVPQPTVNATPLFPFLSPYTIYAGSCSANNPNPNSETNSPGAPAIANVVAPANGIATTTTIQLPALNLTVSNGGKPFPGARVTVTDKTCTDSKGALVKRIYTTNAEGKQSASPEGPAEPALPWGTYELCVSGETAASTFRRVKVTTVTVEDLTSGTAQAIDLASGESGTCP